MPVKNVRRGSYLLWKPLCCGKCRTFINPLLPPLAVENITMQWMLTYHQLSLHCLVTGRRPHNAVTWCGTFWEYNDSSIRHLSYFVIQIIIIIIKRQFIRRRNMSGVQTLGLFLLFKKKITSRKINYSLHSKFIIAAITIINNSNKRTKDYIFKLTLHVQSGPTVYTRKATSNY